VNEKVTALKAAREGDALDTIKSATEALSSSLSKIGEAMMKDHQDAQNAAPKEGADAASGTDTPPEAATDAEFTEKPAE
jgi:hypothetical protein